MTHIMDFLCSHLINKRDLKVNDKLKEFSILLKASENKEQFIIKNAIKYYKYYSLDCSDSENDPDFPQYVHIYDKFYYRKYHIYSCNHNINTLNKQELKPYEKDIHLVC